MASIFRPNSAWDPSLKDAKLGFTTAPAAVSSAEQLLWALEELWLETVCFFTDHWINKTAWKHSISSLLHEVPKFVLS